MNFNGRGGEGSGVILIKHFVWLREGEGCLV